MSKNSKFPKKRLNKSQSKKKIDNSLVRKFDFLVPRTGAIEFEHTPHPLNFFLSKSHVTARIDKEGRFSAKGEIGVPKFFYIPKNIHDKLTELLKDFQIPAELHSDLTWAFLNMAFASCEAPFESHFNNEMSWKLNELFSLLEFLDPVEKDSFYLDSVVFEFSEKLGVDKNGKPNYRANERKTFKGHIAVQYIQEILKTYKQTKGYEGWKMMYDGRKNMEILSQKRFKNAEKEAQAYYAAKILNYLNKLLFNSLMHFGNDRRKYFAEAKRLRSLYSRRKMYLFVGRLMSLSGLVNKTYFHEEDLIDFIKKKLASFHRERRRQIQSSAPAPN